MRRRRYVLLLVTVATALAYGQAADPAKEREQAIKRYIRRKIEQARRATPSPTPKWVNELPKTRSAHCAVLLKEQLEKRAATGAPWGYMGDEVKTCDLYSGLITYYGSLDKAPGFSEATRKDLIQFYQGWQDAGTRRFRRPNQPDQLCNEKYVVAVLGQLGAKPLHPWTANDQKPVQEEKKEKPSLDASVFLKRTADKKEWADGGWGVGSHTGAMACEMFRAINDGQTALIPDLERGIENILSHQDPQSGLWGPPTAELGRRIGGTLKVIGRLGFYLGMEVPHTRELADSLIAHQKNGDWRKAAETCGDVVPRNVVEMIAFCLEASDYRREELWAAMESAAADMQRYDTPDRKRATIEYALGICGAYLHWENCVLGNPTNAFQRGAGYRFKLALQPDGKVKVVERKQGDPDREQVP